MNVLTAYSNKKNINSAVEEIKGAFESISPSLILYFSSVVYDPNELSGKMQTAFGEIPTFGCTTSGEIVTGKMLTNSLVAMAFNEKVIADIKIEVLQNMQSELTVKEAFDSFESHYNTPMNEMDFRKYIGMILIDGLSRAEEKVMDKIGDLTNVNFIGGSAGDDLKFEKTYVFANGKAYTDAAVLALIKPAAGFDIIKTQSFCELSKKLVATKVNEKNREVLEFNNKPASIAYADAIGTDKEKAKDFFMHNPVGLMVDGEPYVRSPQQIKGDSMVFYCNVIEGMELSLLKSTEIIKDTQQALDAKLKETGKVSAIINFNCILRTLELQQKGCTEQYGEIFSDIPTIGFSTYGEEFLGHINQTSTILVLK